jgi:hypothetical protein
VILKSGNRFSEKITQAKSCVILKSGNRFSEKITHAQSCVIPKSGRRFSEKITHTQRLRDPEKWAPVFGEDHAQAKSSKRHRLARGRIAAVISARLPCGL